MSGIAGTANVNDSEPLSGSHRSNGGLASPGDGWVPEHEDRRMVYNLICDSGELLSYDHKAIDGDIKKVKPVDMMDDGGRIILPTRTAQGIKMENAHLPTKLRWRAPRRELADMQFAFGVNLVPKAFKDVLERLEPGVHDFYPVDLFWKDGSPAGSRYWFYPQHRIDTVDREMTTYKLSPLWDSEGDESRNLVFNRRAIGNCHAWIDKFIADSGVVWISERFKQELEASDVTGLGFIPYDETD